MDDFPEIRPEDRIKIMDMLIEKGANVNYVNRNGANLLFTVLDEDKKELSVIEYLLDKVINPNIANLFSFTPLTAVITSSIRKNKDIEKINFEIVDILLKKGALFNEGDIINKEKINQFKTKLIEYYYQIYEKTIWKIKKYYSIKYFE